LASLASSLYFVRSTFFQKMPVPYVTSAIVDPSGTCKLRIVGKIEALSPTCVESTTSALAIPLCLRRSVDSSSNSFGCIVSDRSLVQLERVLLHSTSGARLPE
jgi:hypothetical protein